QRTHEDDALLLRQILLCNGDRRARTAGVCNDTIPLDHAPSHITGRIWVGLTIADHIFHLLTQDAIALESTGLHGIQYAATFVDVADGQLESTELILALIRVGAGLVDDKAEFRVAVDRVVAHGRVIFGKRPVQYTKAARTHGIDTGHCTGGGFEKAPTIDAASGFVVAVLLFLAHRSSSKILVR